MGWLTTAATFNRSIHHIRRVKNYHVNECRTLTSTNILPGCSSPSAEVRTVGRVLQINFSFTSTKGLEVLQKKIKIAPNPDFLFPPFSTPKISDHTITCLEYEDKVSKQTRMYSSGGGKKLN